eukprot:4665297-Amphidinium_carterae.1
MLLLSEAATLICCRHKKDQECSQSLVVSITIVVAEHAYIRADSGAGYTYTSYGSQRSSYLHFASKKAL